MKIKTSFALFAAMMLLACSGQRGDRLDLLPIDPDINLHMAAVERSFDDLYSRFTNLKQDYNKHLTHHFEYQEPQYDSLGEEIPDTTPIPDVYETPFTAHCELDVVTLKPASADMPLSERIKLLDQKLGLLSSCVKGFSAHYFGHLVFCHGITKTLPKPTYEPLKESLAQATQVHILETEIREWGTLVTSLQKDYDEHMKGHW